MIRLAVFWRAMLLLERIVALLPRCSSVQADMHCDHKVHFSTDLSLWLDSPMFGAPWHQSMSTYSQPFFFQFRLEERWDMDKCQLSVISQERVEVQLVVLGANRKSCRVDWHNNGLSDLEWPFHASRAIIICAVDEILVSDSARLWQTNRITSTAVSTALCTI